MQEIPSQDAWVAAQVQRHGKSLQERFASSTVAICGLGGLGSNIALALSRIGIGKLILIDFDRVDLANLHRQQYKATQIGMYKTDALAQNLLEIAPYAELKKQTCRLTPDNLVLLLKDADIICEAFDRAEEKAMLVNGVFEKLPQKYLVAASGMAGLSSGNGIKTRQITKRFILCGDETSEVSEKSGLFASRVMLCAAHQAHAVVRLIAGEHRD